MKNFLGFIFVSAVTVFTSIGCFSDSSSDSSSENDGDPLIVITRIIDHNAVGEFSTYTSGQMTSARSLKVYFEHASVGDDLMNGMGDLISQGYHIGRATISNDAPGVITWFATSDGLIDNYRGNPGFNEKIIYFKEYIDTRNIGNSVDVAMMKFCYIDNGIIPATGFNSYKSAISELEGKFPNVTFVYFTMPLETTGDTVKDEFNTLVRDYCKSNNKFLLDIADIECYSESNVKNMNSGYEALVGAYTNDGGHLRDSANLGRDRAAKALWGLLVNIAAAKK